MYLAVCLSSPLNPAVKVAVIVIVRTPLINFDCPAPTHTHIYIYTLAYTYTYLGVFSRLSNGKNAAKQIHTDTLCHFSI